MAELIIYTAEAIATFIQGGIFNVGALILMVMLSLMAIEFKNLSK